ncbi:MAG TPA: hypothetical protein VEK84_07500, partial [Terriglobales bacterium]|nr:hypothetical protein [Terriglobales bacterium]
MNLFPPRSTVTITLNRSLNKPLNGSRNSWAEPALRGRPASLNDVPIGSQQAHYSDHGENKH